MSKSLERGQHQLDALITTCKDPQLQTASGNRTSSTLIAPSIPEHSPADHEGVEPKIRQLAALSPIEYDRLRGQEAKALNIRGSTLDGLVKAARTKDKEASGTPFGLVEIWPDPIKPHLLLNEIADVVRRFIVCDPAVVDGIALWTAMTWLIDVVSVAPLAVITAPEKRCGKSQLLFLLGEIVCRPLETSNITTAALFRAIGRWRPTLLIDEYDSFVKDKEDLRGIINAGHTPKGRVWRTVGDDHEPVGFDVFSAKALAGIGKLDGTIMDRAIVFPLRRMLPHERSDKLRHSEKGLFQHIASKLARFAEDYRTTIGDAKPEIPQELNDRAQDNWEILLAIADAAGNGWPERARQAALTLSRDNADTQSPGIELLLDIKAIFEQKMVHRLSTKALIEALCEDEERPWATWFKGRRIVPHQLARLLNPYGILSKTIRIHGSTPKGYDRSQFDEVFDRYLSSLDLVDSTATPPQSSSGAEVPVADTRATAATAESSSNAGCGGVADSFNERGSSEKEVEIRL